MYLWSLLCIFNAYLTIAKTKKQTTISKPALDAAAEERFHKLLSSSDPCRSGVIQDEMVNAVNNNLTTIFTKLPQENLSLYVSLTEHEEQ